MLTSSSAACQVQVARWKVGVNRHFQACWVSQMLVKVVCHRAWLVQRWATVYKCKIYCSVIVYCRYVHTDLRLCVGRNNAGVLRHQGSRQLGWPGNRRAIVGVWNRRDWLCTDIYSSGSPHCKSCGRWTNVLIVTSDLTDWPLADSKWSLQSDHSDQSVVLVFKMLIHSKILTD